MAAAGDSAALHLLHGGGGGEGGDGGGAREGALEELAALTEGLGVGVDGANGGGVGARGGEEAVLDGDDKLAADAKLGIVDQEVEGVVDSALEAVLDGDNAVVGHTGLDRLCDSVDGGERDVLVLWGVADSGFLGEGAGGAEVGEASHGVTHAR